METNFDAIKLAVKAATGGKNTVLFDDQGMPSIMVKIPKFRISDVISGGSNSVHPAFIVNGVEKDFIYISKFQNIIINDRAYSLPMQDPATYCTFDTSKKVCENKGKGWHLMSNAEWAAIALWCKKNGFYPHGNNDYGKDITYAHETGVKTSEIDGKIGRVGTGSGAVTWAHDGSNSGIFDLNGNVWEWQTGLRLLDGEIQVIADNNAAITGCDHSVSSTLWKAIKKDGSLVESGTADTLKYDYTLDPGTTNVSKGAAQIVTTVTHKQTNEEPYASGTFETLTAATGITVPEIMKALALAPTEQNSNTGDHLFMRNIGEKLPFRGGSFNNGAASGVFALAFDFTRSAAGLSLGFRSAFVDQ